VLVIWAAALGGQSDKKRMTAAAGH